MIGAWSNLHKPWTEITGAIQGFAAIIDLERKYLVMTETWHVESGWYQHTMTLNWWHRPMSAITRAVSSRSQWWLCRDLCSWLEPMMEIRPTSALRFTEQRMPAEITSLKLLVWNLEYWTIIFYFRWIHGKYNFHKLCGIQFSIEFVGNNIPVEFDLPLVDEFTLEKWTIFFQSRWLAP